MKRFRQLIVRCRKEASMAHHFAAADLGASSGRVIVGSLHEGRFDLQAVRRFPNGPVPGAHDGSLRTDATGLIGQLRLGLDEALRRHGSLAGIGVDTWGVDYGRITAEGALAEPPFHYRDDRTAGIPEELFETLPAADLYAESGLQVMPFNTIFQLIADAHAGPDRAAARTILLTPDLINHWLCGVEAAEVTMASTTGLLRVADRTWSQATCAHLRTRYGIDVPRILPPLVEPGTILGDSTPGLLAGSVPVITVGSHDTASAVVAVPASGTDFAFISSGTWSLVGLELDAPVLTEASRAANFTNELGVDGTVRYLKNVMGLWVLSESMRAWREAGLEVDLVDLLAAAGRLPALACVVDMDDERLLPPGDMPRRLRSLAAETGQALPADPAAVTRCIMDSLALAYRRAIRNACELAGREVSVLHIVGGGCQNALLCQLTADATGLPVVAGPSEGTALGNRLVQARAVGALSGDLTDLRKVAIASSELVSYTPGSGGVTAAAWEAAERILR
jgi:rhamnulokinase